MIKVTPEAEDAVVEFHQQRQINHEQLNLGQDTNSETEVAGTPEPAYLRFGLQGGGCAGFEYQLALEDLSNNQTSELADNEPDNNASKGEEQSDDQPLDLHFKISPRLTILVAENILPLVAGSVIDYQIQGLQTGFKIDNPHAANSCGCGKSFSPREDDIGAQEDLPPCGDPNGCG